MPNGTGYTAGAGWTGVASGAFGPGSFIGSPGAGIISGGKGRAVKGPLSPDMIAWIETLVETTGGKWIVPGRGEQTISEVIDFLSTEQGKGWWESLPFKSKETLMPYYTEEGKASAGGAAQGWSTREHPVLALPWLKGKSTELPSAKNRWGIPSGGGGVPPTDIEAARRQQTALARSEPFSIFRPWREKQYPRVPPARWLLY